MLLHKCALLSIVDLITDISTQMFLHREKPKTNHFRRHKKFVYFINISHDISFTLENICVCSVIPNSIT